MYKNNQTYLANVRCLTNQIQGQTTDFKPDRQSPFSCSQKRNSIKVHQQAMSLSMTKFRFSKILPQAKMSSSNSNVQVSLTRACTYHYKKREFTIGEKKSFQIRYELTVNRFLVDCYNNRCKKLRYFCHTEKKLEDL